MKWLISKNKFLNEAKLRDSLLEPQKDEVVRKWGDKYLDYEEINPTKKIKQGTWKLSKEDKNKVLSTFFHCDIDKLFSLFDSLPDRFVDMLKSSIDFDSLDDDRLKSILSDFNIKNPSLEQIVATKESIFRKLAINDIVSTSIIQKDENDKPIRDENGEMLKIEKDAGEIVFSKNLVNINTFISDYNSLIKKLDTMNIQSMSNDDINFSFSNEKDYQKILDIYSTSDYNDYSVDFNIFNKDIYLKITHNPQDILNMSISKFYSSCQHLYSGTMRESLLANVFDPNSMPAFLIFDTPIYNNETLLSKQLPLSRMIIRNIENFDVSEEKKLYFDRAYPDRMQDILSEIVTSYSGNKNNASLDRDYYLYSPDIDEEDDLYHPYHDRFNGRIKNVTYIGKNTKNLRVTQNKDWSNIKIDPDSKISQLVIETTDLPRDFFKLKLDLEWIKFRFLSITNLDILKNLKTKNYAFDKCKISSDILMSLKDVEKLQFIGCDIDSIDLSNIENLKELHLIYTLDDIDSLKNIIKGTNIKKLIISGDLAGKENKDYLNSLKSNGIKIDTVGPVI